MTMTADIQVQPLIEIVGPKALPVNSSVTLHAKIMGLTTLTMATWTIISGTGTLSTPRGTSTIFTATEVGKVTIKADDGTNTVTITIIVFAKDLSNVFAYPNPYYADGRHGDGIYFDKLTEGSTIQIFTIAGELVKEIQVTISQQKWNIRNESDNKVASGIYIYLIKDPAGNKKVGKLGVIK